MLGVEAAFAVGRTADGEDDGFPLILAGRDVLTVAIIFQRFAENSKGSDGSFLRHFRAVKQICSIKHGALVTLVGKVDLRGTSSAVDHCQERKLERLNSVRLVNRLKRT